MGMVRLGPIQRSQVSPVSWGCQRRMARGRQGRVPKGQGSSPTHVLVNALSLVQNITENGNVSVKMRK